MPVVNESLFGGQCCSSPLPLLVFFLQWSFSLSSSDHKPYRSNSNTFTSTEMVVWLPLKVITATYKSNTTTIIISGIRFSISLAFMVLFIVPDYESQESQFPLPSIAGVEIILWTATKNNSFQWCMYLKCYYCHCRRKCSICHGLPRQVGWIFISSFAGVGPSRSGLGLSSN